MKSQIHSIVNISFPGDAVTTSASETETEGAEDRSGDTAETFKAFEQPSVVSSFAPPADATSTPMRTIQFPSELQMQSSKGQPWVLFSLCSHRHHRSIKSGLGNAERDARPGHYGWRLDDQQNADPAEMYDLCLLRDS